MSLVASLPGPAAILLLCALIYTEEAGVPMPFLPGDGLLILSGILIATGTVNPFVGPPAEGVAAVAGAFTGYTWSRRLGAAGLRSLAERLRAGSVLDRASRHVQSTGSAGVIAGRLIPGTRVYTTLVAGSAGMDKVTFFRGLIPAVAIWIAAFNLLGFVVGVPAELLLVRVQRLALDAVVLLAIPVGAYFAVRHIPPFVRRNTALASSPRWWRLILSLLLDVAIVFTAVSAISEGAQDLLHLGEPDGTIDFALITGTFVLLYVFVGRWRVGATPGELLLNTTYTNRPLR